MSFASVASWKAIYGHSSPGTQQPIKSEFYDIYGSGFRSLCIGSERNPAKHQKMKKSLAAAFSTKALLEQEEIVTQTIDKFIARVYTEGRSSKRGVNLTKWFEMVSFDILGEMAFGESFGSIESGKWLISSE